MAVPDRAPAQALARPVPPVAFVLGAATSIQFGAALAATIFDDIGPAGTSLLRIDFAAIMSARVGAQERDEDDGREADAQQRRARRPDVVEDRRRQRRPELDRGGRAQDEGDRRDRAC